ncbi:TIR domain-containing adapter molecule 1 [Suncus etruscus]|uniref:TIR domain-containing adapter molecule 1 n=1 Tax=Suncus etruscus TaxID=109475 RepID=UPI00210F4622|nr:TIR domain-containing adapter molecule 1 [Suncus etruscus]
MAHPSPSLSGVFAILRTVGEQRLLHLKHKLKSLRTNCPRADLLLALVLLQLGQDTQARACLDALRADKVAQLMAHQWASKDGSPVPDEPPEVSWAVAQLYHLLAEENLCSVPMRDAAYQAALHRLRSGHHPQLRELQEEARAHCGWDLTGDLETLQPLRSDLGHLPSSSPSPPSRTCSPAQPIEGPPGWSRGRSLRSTGSPTSLASQLLISQSPTRPFLSLQRGPVGPSKLCMEPEHEPGPGPGPTQDGGQVPEEMSWPPSSEPSSPPQPAPQLPVEAPDVSPTVPPEPPVPAHAESSWPSPVQCTEEPGWAHQAPTGSKQPPTGSEQPPTGSVNISPDPDQKFGLSPKGETWTSSATPGAPQTSSPPPSRETPSGVHPFPLTPSPSLPTSAAALEQKFYNFVVLHTQADERVALRVRQHLEDLGVPDGATFCEDFQLPGRGELSCLQDAIDHSAFTVLLLTPSFNCRLSLHQVNRAVMGSLSRRGWHDSVVPFLPLESSLEQLGPDTAALLAGMVWLEERSPVFDRKVARTFKPQLLLARRAEWRKEQEARALRERHQQLQAEQQRIQAWAADYSTYWQSYQAFCQQMQQLQADLGKYMTTGPRDHQSVPPAFPTWPGHPAPLLPPWPPGIPPPAFPQAPAFQPHQSPHPTFSPASPQSPGLQPLIIHNAQMVQLGLNNHMWGQRGAQVPQDKKQEAE